MSKLSDFKDACRPLEPGEDDGWDELRRIICNHVVEAPIMAGYGQNVGNWKIGDIGACTIVSPTLKEAKKWLKDHPKRKRRKKA